MEKKRKPIPKDIELCILFKSKRRCALCFHYNCDLCVKEGQIAHIDRNPENCVEENLAWLCLLHHNQYDTRPSQSKSFQKSELAKAKADLLAYLSQHNEQILSVPHYDSTLATHPSRGIALDVFQIRLPVYRAFQKIALHIVREAIVPHEVLFEYLREIQDALFLFDEDLDQYLLHVYRQAVRLRGLQGRMEQPERYNNEQWSKIVDDETDLILWFDKQLEEGRNRFNRYLNITDQ
ncbi:MAG: hypothetical protein AB1724_02000 [Thermodesulfobacteriota bacterium]